MVKTKQVVTTTKVVGVKKNPNKFKPSRKTKRRGLPFRRAGGGVPIAYNSPRMGNRPSMFNPVTIQTSDKIATIALGLEQDTIIFKQALSPQSMPPGTLARRYSEMYVNYKIKSATINVRSAISSIAGGQYGVFFDPNPTNIWTGAKAAAALPSMPTKRIENAYQSVVMPIPSRELHKDHELYTATQTNEHLVTEFGQVVLMNMVNSATTPPGSATVLVFLDVEWVFYEPNISPGDAVQKPYLISAGNWSIAADNKVTHPAANETLPGRVAYQLFPSMPGTFVSSGTATPWMAINNGGAYPGTYLFDTLAQAQEYAEFGYGTSLNQGATPTESMPDVVAVALNYY